MTPQPGTEKDPLTGAILRAAFEVAGELGHGFLEAVYVKALCRELALAGLKVAREVPFRISYKGEDVGAYLADFVVENTVIVEMKAVAALGPAHVGQLLNYLRASGLRTGLLLNFGKPTIEYKRVAL